MKKLYDRLNANPVIAAIKDGAAFEAAVKSECEVIFLLSGNICNINQTVNAAHSAGKEVYIHIDLMDGFGRDKYTIQYIKETIAPDGIITTRSPLIKIAKEFELTAIQRIFLIDNLSLKTGIQSVGLVKPDAIEVLPGLMPKVIKTICASVKTPVITGGLINDKEDIIACLNAGAVGVSTSKPSLWE